MEDNKNSEEVILDSAEETVDETSNIDELKQKVRQADEHLDRLLRLTAEFDNFRKRTIKEKEALYTDGMADCAAKFLPLVDNMDRCILALKEEKGSEGMLQGIELIFKQLQDIIKELKIEAIPALGEEFNPEIHNAVMHIEDEAIDSNTIVEEFQKGYIMNGKVLRHSMVKVAN